MKIGWRFSRRRAVTLVVDDGPSDATAQLLDMLQRHGHRAVLFILGCNVAGREATLVDAVRRGFALGNHSFDHPYFSQLDIAAASAEITATEVLIDAAYADAGIRRPGKWFRFPYLDTGGAQFEPLQALLGDLGFERPDAIGARLAPLDLNRRDWPTTVNTGDWAMPEDAMFRVAMRQANPGDIIEFHDKPEGISRYNGALLDELAALSLRGVVPGDG
jgi:peptidoglycan/xylan/chitin deacetylase (PgdA/CDA1 family)